MGFFNTVKKEAQSYWKANINMARNYRDSERLHSKTLSLRAGPGNFEGIPRVKGSEELGVKSLLGAEIGGAASVMGGIPGMTIGGINGAFSDDSSVLGGMAKGAMYGSLMAAPLSIGTAINSLRFRQLQEVYGLTKASRAFK